MRLELTLHLAANTSRHDHWGWKVPRDNDPARFSAVATDAGRSLLLHDSRGELGNCFSFEHKPAELLAQGSSGRAVWRQTLPPGGTLVVNYALAVGENGSEVHGLAAGWAGHFDAAFARVSDDWQQRFDAMFQPRNSFFSGHLPKLVTSDEKLRRTYYMSAVTLLSLCRTCFPGFSRVYVSNSPESNCTMMYFWDTQESPPSSRCSIRR